MRTNDNRRLRIIPVAEEAEEAREKVRIPEERAANEGGRGERERHLSLLSPFSLFLSERRLNSPHMVRTASSLTGRA